MNQQPRPQQRARRRRVTRALSAVIIVTHRRLENASMFKKIAITFVSLFLFFASIVNAETSGRKQVAKSGETVVTAKSPQLNLQVRIKTLNIEKDVKQQWGKQLPFVPSTCTFSSWCSVVNEIDIIVNGNKIFVPHSLIADLQS